MVTKVDLVKEDKTYYTARANPQIIELPKVSCLAIEGKGEPAGKHLLKQFKPVPTLPMV